mmetsp:Transcript_17132/g.44530  ORF Transcript_17132/g.44530 Transcript_17132/m.44530 type:complete len:405 (-) Transcript_17132:1654-2868(-)
MEISSCFRLSKSTTRRSEFVKPCFCLRAAFSALSASFSLLALVRRSRSLDSSESSEASESRVTLFSALTNCSFSLMWVSTCTFDVFFFLSLCSSSLRSSIFSFSVWFSILSCSKSIRWRPSASCSLARRESSSLRRIIRRLMFRRRTLTASWSFRPSCSWNICTVRFAMGLPVRECSACSAISALNSLKLSAMSEAFASLSSSLFCRSMATRSNSAHIYLNLECASRIEFRVSLYCFSLSWLGTSASLSTLGALVSFTRFWLAKIVTIFRCSSEFFADTSSLLSSACFSLFRSDAEYCARMISAVSASCSMARSLASAALCSSSSRICSGDSDVSSNSSSMSNPSPMALPPAPPVSCSMLAAASAAALAATLAAKEPPAPSRLVQRYMVALYVRLTASGIWRVS